MPDFLRETTPRARTARQCSLCAGAIASGERYTRTTLVYGSVYDWLECQHCTADNVASTVMAAGYDLDDEGIGYEDAIEWALEEGCCNPIAQRFLARTPGEHEPRTCYCERPTP